MAKPENLSLQTGGWETAVGTFQSLLKAKQDREKWILISPDVWNIFLRLYKIYCALPMATYTGTETNQIIYKTIERNMICWYN